MSSLATCAAVLQDIGSGDCTSYSIVVTPSVTGLMTYLREGKAIHYTSSTTSTTQTAWCRSGMT